MNTKYLKYASLVAWLIGVVFMVIALFTMDKWISIPMILFLILGSVLNYIYTRMVYVDKDDSNVDDKTDK